MCGIAGLLSVGPGDEDGLRATAQRLNDAIAHRGPDGSGIWAEGGVALAHRRLAIIDLSEAGAQPMLSDSGRFVLSYNGEIYNFESLRREIEASGRSLPWRGHSDTEVLLAGFELWGVEATLSKADGMFGIALWDRSEKVLHLARDRFGEKPLYYGLVGGALLFSSELRGLRRELRLGDADVDLESLEWLFQTSNVPAPRSIFRQVRKMPPASWVSVRPDDLREGRLPEPKAYWSAVAAARTAAASPFQGNETEALDRLAELLSASIRLRLVADVPVGAMLSGGIDSTCVSALAQSLSSKPLRTFTVGFDQGEYDESAVGAAVAAAIGSDHATLNLGAGEALAVVPRMASLYDEPFADSSQVATFMVSQALRSEVTVALSGDAGDELFGGYNRYFSAPRLWRRLGAVPRPIRSTASSLLSTSLGSRASGMLAAGLGASGEGAARIGKGLGLVGAADENDVYRRLLRHWPPNEHVSRFDGALASGADTREVLNSDLGFERRMMLADTIDYLPNDILTKVDRAAMAVALETRVPFLDPALFAFAWSLPLDFLIQGGVGKLPLRRLAGRYVDPSITGRPKQGFAAPVAAWLRGPLASWADDLLSPARLSRSGYYQVDRVEKAWRAHRTGAADQSARLWPILMFEAWRDAA